MRSQELHSALEPAGPQAELSLEVFRVMLPIAALVYVLVLAALLLIWRRQAAATAEASPHQESSARRAVIAAIGLTVLILFGVLLHDLSVSRAMSRPHGPAPVVITVTGHQWWWEVEYEDSLPQNRVTLANEIHLPVGRPALIKLRSQDVIHSFWVPNLAGKKDLIPGHHTSLWIRSDRPGLYRGQCAEFCGLQHARMGLVVVVESESRFAEWLELQRQPSPAPGTGLAGQGRTLFESGPCAVCHAVQGTAAAGRVGPDLTHVAGRLTLAAGTLPNTAENLARWIRDPQAIKPGARMPITALTPEQLRALTAYLETLR